MDLSEKYRPTSLSEIVGQTDVVNGLRNIIEQFKQDEENSRLPHFLFVGPSGCGKTSTAFVIAEELSVPIIEYNATDKIGVDLVRGEITRRSRIRSLSRDAFGGEKVAHTRIIFLDECDSVEEKAQQALRRTMEKTRSTTFILSFNDHTKISDPIRSRCTVFKFQKLPEEIILERLIEICRSEGYFNTAFPADAREGLLALVRFADGDMRDALSELPKYVTPEGLDYKSMMKLPHGALV